MEHRYSDEQNKKKDEMHSYEIAVDDLPQFKAEEKKLLAFQDVELSQEEAGLAAADELEAMGDKELAALLRSAFQPEKPKKKKIKKQSAKDKADAKKAVKAAKKTSEQTLRDVIPADERDEGLIDFLYKEDPSGDIIESVKNKLAEPSTVDPGKTWYDVCEEAAFRDLQLDDLSAFEEQIRPYKNGVIVMYYDYLCDKFVNKVQKIIPQY